MFGCEMRDSDAGENGEMYFYLDGPDADYFVVDEHTGIVTASQQLDSTTDGSTFSIVIQVANKGCGKTNHLLQDLLIRLFWAS